MREIEREKGRERERKREKEREREKERFLDHLPLPPKAFEPETLNPTLKQIREREIFLDNLLVRVHLIIEMSRPALRHGSLNPPFQVALYLPS